MRRLGERFGELESEMIIRMLTDVLSYVRSPRQDIDAALTQFDILYARAVESASMSVSPSILAYFLLSAMLIGPKAWPMLFYPWGGAFPTTDEHLAGLKRQIRVQGHMLEAPPQQQLPTPRPTHQGLFRGDRP